MQDQPGPSTRVLGVFRLATLTMAAVIGIRNLPQMAEYGWASIFFYVAAMLFFFIPISLVSAELATGWPKRGGIYIWVREAFGPRVGFFAIWTQWIACIPWYPAVLSFLAATIAYSFNPSLADSKIYMLITTLILVWAATIANFFEIKVSSWISSGGMLIGSLIPAALIVGLGLYWSLAGYPTEIAFSVASLIPDFGMENVVFFAGVVLALSGMELSASSASEVIDPQRNFPRAILMAAVVILAVSILGSLAIAFVIPKEELSLVAGIMPAVEVFFAEFGLTWAVPWVALLIVLGTVALVNTWFLAPAKGMLVTARYGDLPAFFKGSNRHGAPVRLLIIQGAITSLFCVVFVFVPDVNTAFWILSILAIQLYIIMYVLVFLSVIRLRYTQPEVPRTYKIPGGKGGVILVAILGLIGCLYAFVVGFFPPAELNVENVAGYVSFLVVGMIVLGVPPLIIYQVRRKNL
ncbi:MAG: amino acid permease [Candidatus Zixiibacteriota bacterium]|nr:MAG: amino acid permease [candidate division Zixibacteria bacterium]